VEMSLQKNTLAIVTLALMVLMAACWDRRQNTAGSAPGPTSTAAGSPSPAPTTATNVANKATDKWLGRWTGVEGTYLNLSKSGAKYVVEIADLDGPKTYEGVSAGDHIEFKRGGGTESIRATDGKGTGMKWLTREKNCLVITAGSEGYCRK
jgi:hypothetical protein